MSMQNSSTSAYSSTATFAASVSSSSAGGSSANSLLLSVYRAYNYASFYVEAPFVLSGLFFNVHVVLVLLCTPYSSVSTTRFYYTLIASCDISTLIAKHTVLYLFGNGIFVLGTRTSVSVTSLWTVQTDVLACRVIYSIWLIVEITSNCSLVALGVERAVAVYWPFKVRHLTRRRSMIGMACLFALALVVSPIGALNCLVQTNPYITIGQGCYAGGGVSIAVAIAAPGALFCDYLIPSLLSITLAVLIVVKLRKVQASKVAMSRDREQAQGLSANEIESCITLIFMSCLHVLFFLPLTTFRTLAIMLPFFVSLDAQTRSLITGVGLLLYVLASPFYSANFFIYCRRVKGFLPNVKRLWRCQSLVEEK